MYWGTASNAALCWSCDPQKPGSVAARQRPTETKRAELEKSDRDAAEALARALQVRKPPPPPSTGKRDAPELVPPAEKGAAIKKPRKRSAKKPEAMKQPKKQPKKQQRKKHNTSATATPSSPPTCVD